VVDKRIYLAGLLNSSRGQRVNWPWIYDELDTEQVFTLESFWYDSYVRRSFSEKGFKIFLDSGAYSWYTFHIEQGKAIDEKAEHEYMDRYATFINTYADRIHAYVNLDVIFDPERSWVNLNYLEKQGLTPIPVYHLGEDIWWFERMVDEYDYIGIGGAVSSGYGFTLQRKKIDELFTIIYNRNREGIKVHGFGKTGWKDISRYPWYSVDSTTWIMVAANGSILAPRWNPNEQRFDGRSSPVVITLSGLSKVKDSNVLGHFQFKLSDDEIKKVFEYFEFAGLVLEDMEKNYWERWRANVIYFKLVSEELRREQTKKYLKSDKPLF